MLVRQFRPCSLPFCPPTLIIVLWVVSLDRGNEVRLIIASASSWISSKLEPVWFVWTQLSPLQLHPASCLNINPSTYFFFKLQFFLCQIPISQYLRLHPVLRFRKVFFSFTSHIHTGSCPVESRSFTAVHWELSSTNQLEWHCIKPFVI